MHTLPEIRHAYEVVTGCKASDNSQQLLRDCLDLTALDVATAEGELILRLQQEARLTGNITYAYHPPLPIGGTTITAGFTEEHA